MPSFEDLRYAIRRRVRRGRYVLEDASYAARRTRCGVLSRAPATRGRGLTLRTRYRIAAGALVVLALVVAVALIAVPNLPCQVAGRRRVSPPTTRRSGSSPATRLAYVHVDTTRSTEQYEQAAALAKRLPDGHRAGGRRPPAAARRGDRLQRDVAPWLGGEAALALVPAGSGERAGPRCCSRSATRRAPRRFVDGIAGRDPKTESHDGVEVRIGRRWPGRRAGRRIRRRRPRGAGRAEVIETEAGGHSLADSDARRRGAATRCRTCASPSCTCPRTAPTSCSRPEAPLASLEAFVNARATLGAGAALVATESGLELEIHSVLDPERAESAPGFFAAFPSFEPELAGELSEDALAYLALGDPRAEHRRPARPGDRRGAGDRGGRSRTWWAGCATRAR